MKRPPSTTHRFRLTSSFDSAPTAHTSPARTSNESPGRKNPMRRPVSANTTANSPRTPNVSSKLFGSIIDRDYGLVPFGPAQAPAPVRGSERTHRSREPGHL